MTKTSDLGSAWLPQKINFLPAHAAEVPRPSFFLRFTGGDDLSSLVHNRDQKAKQIANDHFIFAQRGGPPVTHDVRGRTANLSRSGKRTPLPLLKVVVTLSTSCRLTCVDVRWNPFSTGVEACPCNAPIGL